ncbi:MAG: signal peptide peptidase SppA [Planctomycetaceae bacterium]
MKTSRMRWSTVLTLLLLLIILGGCAFVYVPLIYRPRPLEEKVVAGEGEAKILLLEVSGIISEEKEGVPGVLEKLSMIDRFQEALKKAESDKKIAAVIVRINSPGGTVTASDILYHEILRFKKKTGKRVVACLMGVAASGGYYTAMAADEVVAHPTTVTGSIGVIAVKFNVQELFKKIGVGQETIKSGALKDILSPFRPSTPEEKKILQELIDQLYGRFLEVVTAGRKDLARTEVVKLADGRIYTAQQALDRKLVDRIGYLDDAIEGVKSSLHLTHASVIVYYRPGSYKSTIYSGLNEGGSPVFNLISIDGESILSSQGVRFLYLWMP